MVTEPQEDLLRPGVGIAQPVRGDRNVTGWLLMKRPSVTVSLDCRFKYGSHRATRHQVRPNGKSRVL